MFSSIKTLSRKLTQPFHDGGRYHIETSPMICRANQWSGFYMITASLIKGLMFKMIPDIMDNYFDFKILSS